MMSQTAPQPSLPDSIGLIHNHFKALHNVCSLDGMTPRPHTQINIWLGYA